MLYYRLLHYIPYYIWPHVGLDLLARHVAVHTKIVNCNGLYISSVIKFTALASYNMDKIIGETVITPTTRKEKRLKLTAQGKKLHV